MSVSCSRLSEAGEERSLLGCFRTLEYPCSGKGSAGAYRLEARVGEEGAVFRPDAVFLSYGRGSVSPAPRSLGRLILSAARGDGELPAGTKFRNRTVLSRPLRHAPELVFTGGKDGEWAVRCDLLLAYEGSVNCKYESASSGQGSPFMRLCGCGAAAVEAPLPVLRLSFSDEELYIRAGMLAAFCGEARLGFERLAQSAGYSSEKGRELFAVLSGSGAALVFEREEAPQEI